MKFLFGSIFFLSEAKWMIPYVEAVQKEVAPSIANYEESVLIAWLDSDLL